MKLLPVDEETMDGIVAASLRDSYWGLRNDISTHPEDIEYCKNLIPSILAVIKYHLAPDDWNTFLLSTGETF